MQDAPTHGLDALTLRQFQQLKRLDAIAQIGKPIVVVDHQEVDIALDDYKVPRRANAYLAGESVETYRDPDHFWQVYATPVVFYKVEK